MPEARPEADPDARVRRRPRWAVWTSEALAPAVLALAVPLVVGGALAGWRGGLLALAAALLAVGPPLTLVVHLVRSGRAVDHHLPDRGDRPRVLALALLGAAAAVALLLVTGAPAGLLVMFGTVVALLLVLAVVSARWKVSLHAAVAAASLGALVAVAGPAAAAVAVVGVPLVVVLAASRLVLGAHTPGQVVVGLVLGAAAAVVAALAG